MLSPRSASMAEGRFIEKQHGSAFCLLLFRCSLYNREALPLYGHPHRQMEQTLSPFYFTCTIRPLESSRISLEHFHFNQRDQNAFVTGLGRQNGSAPPPPPQTPPLSPGGPQPEVCTRGPTDGLRQHAPMSSRSKPLPLYPKHTLSMP